MTEKSWEIFIGTFALLVAISITVGCVFIFPHTHIVEVFSSVILGMAASLIALLIISKLDKYVRLNHIKSYWIEDCGNVIKLHGSVQLAWRNQARRDLLSLRKGFKIVAEAYEQYGCTMAAVEVTSEEISTINQLGALGFDIRYSEI